MDGRDILAPGELQIHSSLMCGTLSTGQSFNLPFPKSVTLDNVTIMSHTILCHESSSEKEMRGKNREILPSSLPPWLTASLPEAVLQPP